jgi:CHASE3 domain sensor protein
VCPHPRTSGRTHKRRKAVNYSLVSEVHPAPEHPTDKLATRISASLCLVAFAALILTAMLSVRTLTGLVSAENAVSQDLTIGRALQNLMSQLLNAETGQRGFLLSGLPTYLEPYYAALAQIRESRAAAIKSLSSEPSAIGELGMLDRAVTAKLKELDHTIGLKSAGRVDEASQVVRTGVGKQTMDDVREAIRLLVASVDRRTEQARAEQS